MTISFSELKLTRAIFGGITSGIIIFLGTFLTGNIGSWEAIELIAEMRDPLLFTCSAILTSTATILALILTLLSISSSDGHKLKAIHYVRIQWISKLAIFAFIASLLLLLLLNLPVKNSTEEIRHWFKPIYYTILVYSAILGGSMVSLILMLYQAAHEIILIAHPEEDSSFLVVSEDEKEEIEEELEEKE